MDDVFCAYVFGPEWQDIKYFRDINTALECMKKDAQHHDEAWHKEFPPMVISYRVGENGCTYEKDVWKMDKNGCEAYCRTTTQE